MACPECAISIQSVAELFTGHVRVKAFLEGVLLT